MVDRAVVFEALSEMLHANVMPFSAGFSLQSAQECLAGSPSASTTEILDIRKLLTKVLEAEDSSNDSSSLDLAGSGSVVRKPSPAERSRVQSAVQRKDLWLDDTQFFEPPFDFVFPASDTDIFYRGKEKYQRPSGWTRFALKILNKYPDGNVWLGTTNRSTRSDEGEWPVSFHGTSMAGAQGIVKGHYEPGPRQLYGRGIYSSPFMADAIDYAKTFVSKKDRKTYQVILQNRINPAYREKCPNSSYWLVKVPERTSSEKEVQLVERAIRPYGILLKAI